MSKTPKTDEAIAVFINGNRTMSDLIAAYNALLILCRELESR